MKKKMAIVTALMLCTNITLASAEYAEYDLDTTVFQSPTVEFNLDEQEFQSPDLDEQEFQTPNLDEQVFQGDNAQMVYQYFTDADYDALIACQDAWALAHADGDESAKEKAHQDAETIRAKYGFSGGADGSQVIRL